MIEKIGPFILVGTSHVATQSIEEIHHAIEKYSPGVIGIELDHQRLKGLYSKEKRPSFRMLAKEVGAFGAMFAILAGSVQKKIGKHLGVKPGLDMKAAYEKARELSIPVALVDVPIKTTLKRFSAIPFSKKISMFFSMFTKSFKKEYRNKLQFDVKKGVPGDKQIEDMLKMVEKEVPLFYDILIEKRNIHMVSRALNLQDHHPESPILLVVGAGHVRGMKALFEKKLQTTNDFTYSFTLED